MARKPTLLEEINQAKAIPGRPCTVGLILNSIGDEADQLRAALRDPSIQSVTIAKVLTGRGYRVSGDVMARHRRGICRCES